MYLAESLLARSSVYTILATIDFFMLLGSYGFLRLIRISANWVTWIIGSLIILASTLLCLSLLLPQQQQLAPFRGTGNLLGALSFLVAVYTAAQWITRQWYVLIKKRTKSVIVTGSKYVLLFLRKHHQFFGWVITCAALAHMVFFLPVLNQVREYEVVTGFVALGILAISVVLGCWLWLLARMKKRAPKSIHSIHATLTIAFFVALFMHM